MASNRQLAAVMFSDLVGYTSLMQKDISLAKSTVIRFRTVLEKLVHEHDGKIIQYYGDGSLCLFGTATAALRCGLQIQKELRTEPKVDLRIGIHLGEILIEGDYVYGQSVNIASRIESVGQPGTVLFSRNVHREIANQPEFQCMSIGHFHFKNVEEIIEVYSLVHKDLSTYSIIPPGATLRENGKSGIWRTKIKWVVAVLFIAIAGLSFWRFKLVSGIGENVERSGSTAIAVLPFDNYSPNSQDEYLANAVSDEIRSQLNLVPGLKVVSRYSSRYFKDKSLSAKEIAKELNVQYILEGNVQRLDELIKIGVDLNNIKTDKLEWSLLPTERMVKDLFAIQNEIAGQIVTRLSVRLTKDDRSGLEKLPTTNSLAYEKFLQANELMVRSTGTLEELDGVVARFQEAIALDSAFDRAYIGLAEAYLGYEYWGRWKSKQAAELATGAISRVSDLKSSEYYGVLGNIHFLALNRELAVENLEKAIELNPNNASALSALAWIRVNESSFMEAHRLMSEAKDLDPLSIMYPSWQAFIYCLEGDCQASIDFLKPYFDLKPRDNQLLWSMGYLSCSIEDYANAVQLFENRTAVGHDTNWMLGYAYGMLGQTVKAKEILNFQLERRQTQHVPAYMIATIYMGLKDYQKALDWLEIDIREGGTEIFPWFLHLDFKFQSLFGESRFQKLVEEVG